ncbi:hypothetical protein DFS34DRAFT_598578 [Phlyctochytrium arcticum]|nr:hypothetical protein DFS34DRAFT_598578 [Phlyctochytrium arcticum]
MRNARLPAEICFLILQNISHPRTLVNCSYICRSWKHIIRPRLFRNVKLRDQANFDMCLGQLTTEPHLGNQVQSLILPMTLQDPLPSSVVSLWKLCPNLKKFVSFSGLRQNQIVCDSHIKALVQSCTQLEVISILPAYALTDKGVMAIAANCPKLLSLNISSAHRITDASVRKLVDSCTVLEDLVLMGTPITSEGALYIVKHGKNLKFLNLSGCLINSDEAETLHNRRPTCLELVAGLKHSSDEEVQEFGWFDNDRNHSSDEESSGISEDD